MAAGRKLLRIGLVGCGVIGTHLARAIEDRFEDKARLVAVADVDIQKAKALAKGLKRSVKILPLDSLIEKSDLIIEAASVNLSADLLRRAIFAGRDVMLMSTGGLLGNEDLLRKAEARGIRVYLPSGAICGIDGVKAASIGKVSSITLTTRKPPQSLGLTGISSETVLFDGPAKEAVKKFPQNINVAATLSLASQGARKLRVRIITSPEFKTNSHELEVEGEFGSLSARTDNLPSPENPKTSQLAIFSAIATLEGVFSNVKVGT